MKYVTEEGINSQEVKNFEKQEFMCLFAAISCGTEKKRSYNYRPTF